MTASYALSPAEIDAVVEAAYADGRQAAKRDGDDALLLVAETDGRLAGVAEGRVDDDAGTVRRLHVDPECRDRGIGTRLFERTVDALREGGADRVRAAAIDAATEAGTFYGTLGFEVVDERPLDLEALETVEYLYADVDDDGPGATADSEVQSSGPEAPDDPDEFPETVTTDEGERVHLGDDRLSGNEAPFAPTYADAGHHEAFGYYCGNCGGTDVSVDSSDRLRCGDCGNTHRASEAYDGSYL